MNATMPMRYADALRAVAGSTSVGQRLRLFASATTAEFTVFLRAFAVGRGRDWLVERQDYGPLQAQLDAAGGGADAVVVLVAVEDVFPELSYRADADWSLTALDDLVAGAAERVTAVVRQLSRSIVAAGDPVVVVPPVLGPPMLPVRRAVAMGLARLPEMIRAALDAELTGTAVRVLDVEDALRELAPSRRRDDGLLLVAGSPFATDATAALAREVDGLLAPMRAVRKVLVTDLDGTLWHGVYSEDGIRELNAHPHGPGQAHRVWQRMLRILMARGVLLAVCSKNDPEVLDIFAEPEAREAVGLLLTDDDLSAASTSWAPKSEQLRGLAARLGLGLDAFVFVDDDLVELAEVTAAVPAVLAVRFPADGRDLHDFCRTVCEAFAGVEAVVTEEDSRRAELYRMRDQVESARHLTESTVDFLTSLRMRLLVEHVVGAEQLAAVRARQLLNRTNQFNLTGQRYAEHEWHGLVGRPSVDLFTARLLDTYGDHGLCAVLVLDTGPNGTAIVELALSCRVFNRTVEDALLAWITSRASTPVVAEWRRTGRNDQVLDAFLGKGFRVSFAAGDRTVVTTDGAEASGTTSSVVVEEAGPCAS